MPNVRRLTFSALLIALSVVATRFLSVQTPVLRIGFGGIPIMLVGLAFGPIWGFLSGAMADLVGFFGFGQGTYFPGFTLTAGLVGAVVPLILGKRRFGSNYSQLLIAVAVSQVVTSLILDTYWLTILTGKAAVVILPLRALNQLIYIPIATSLVFFLRRLLARFVGN